LDVDDQEGDRGVASKEGGREGGREGELRQDLGSGPKPGEALEVLREEMITKNCP
jgi:hypothetical protein